MHRILLPSDPLTAPTWVPGHGVVVLLKGIGLVLVSPSGTTSTISDSRLGLLGTPQQVAVSPDGTRIALRTGPAQPGSSPAEPGEPVEPSTVWVGRLARHGSAIAAEAWLPVATGVQDVAELAWSGPAELLVTGRRTDSPVALWRVDLARLADPVRLAGAGLPAVPGPVSASDGASPLVVDAGHAWRLDGERWTDLGPVRAVARPH
jgi:hypothetical protein